MLIAYHRLEKNMLADDLKTLLATEYAYSIKAQFFHWNVEGPDFAQLHEFFGNLYEEVYNNSIDRTAEYIRSLDDYTPGSFDALASSVPLKDS
jgi:starvation-inducible DNA-binding protein